MRFALLGDHPDGLDMARALVESGRHELAAYVGPPVGAEYLRRWGVAVKPVGDSEEVLADPGVEAVVVAGRPADRPAQLRRALQSERHVLCVHPADPTPDLAYEAALIQGDTGRVLLPLLPEALHPGVLRLAELARDPQGPLGTFQIVEMKRGAPEAVLLETGTAGHKPALPGWDVLRAVGGEVAEVFAFAAAEEVAPEEPLLLAGRFERGGLFQASFLPGQQEPRWQLTVVGTYGRAELTFPLGWPGPARLTWHDEAGQGREETWDAWNPWPALVEIFEAAVGYRPAVGPPPVAVAASHAVAAGLGLGEGKWGSGSRETSVAPAGSLTTSATSPGIPVRAEARPPHPKPRLTWQDAVRGLELDDAARRSVARRRASALEYQEATEEAGFKGTMTLLGCSLLWVSLLLLILSAWVPWLGWLIVPVFGLFLTLQLLRWVVPAAQGQARAARVEEPIPDEKDHG